jgi:methionyl-tRNA formyltransferase
MKIVYFSKGIRGATCLAHIIQAGYPVEAIIGVSPEKELESLSQKYQFPVIYPEKLNTTETEKVLKGYQPDLFILSGYNKILKSIILGIPPQGTINLHGGKLPEYRGAAPINWQIINGETTGGCSIIYVDEGIDTGDIIAQEYYPILPDDTHASVLEKTLEIFPPLLVKVLKEIEDGKTNPIPQDPLQGKYYCRRYPRDSKIKWAQMNDDQVHNLVRGMHGPYPAAFTYKGDIKIEIDKTRLLEETIIGIPGRIPQKRGESMIVLARNRALLVEAITVEGKAIAPSELLQIGDDLV